MLELTPNPFIVPAGGIPVIGGVKLAEREMLARPHIAEPRRTARQHKADVRDSRQAASAAEPSTSGPANAAQNHYARRA